MVKLNCLIVGDGSVISIIIEEWMRVSRLKKAIKAEKRNYLSTIDANELQLFLAKKDGAWLSIEDTAALQLEEGKIHEEVQTMIDGKPMVASCGVQEWLDEKNARAAKKKNPRVGGGVDQKAAGCIPSISYVVSTVC